MTATTDDVLDDGPAKPHDAGGGSATDGPKHDSPMRRTWRRLTRNPLALFSMVWVALLVVAWIWPELLATRDPFKGDPSLQDIFLTPNGEYWLGTDGLGRDYYSRVVHGAGFAFQSIAIAMSIAVGIGVPLGLFSGWRGGRVDRWIMWINDVLFSMPIVSRVHTVEGSSIMQNQKLRRSTSLGPISLSGQPLP